MFENAALIHPAKLDGDLNIGRILDAMLYYGKVEFLVDQRSFIHLWHRIGYEGTLDLLSHSSMDCRITPEMPAVQTHELNGVQSHAPQFISHAGRDEFVINDKDTATKIAYGLDKENFREIRPKINRIIKSAKDTRYYKIFEDLPIKGDLFRDLISDSETLKLFVGSFAARLGVEVNQHLLNQLAVEVYDTPHGYMINANVHPSELVPGHLINGWQELLPMVHDYQLDLRFAQSRSADLMCGEVSSEISSQRLDLSLNRALKSENQLSAFEQFAFGEARPFGQAFEEGIIDVKTALEVIDKTAKFREWLHGKPVDADLIKEFHQAVTRETLLDKLPGRTSRFAIFTGGGLALDALVTGGVGTLAGIGLSAIDAFVIDGLLKGWKPSNFVKTVGDSIAR